MVISFGYGGIPENVLHILNASISKIVQYWEDYKSAKRFALITKISFFCKNLLHYHSHRHGWYLHYSYTVTKVFTYESLLL